jgi:hypothetical protein
VPAVRVPARLWPTPAQDRALDVAVGPDRRVAAAFATWVASVDLDDYFDFATFRLLPLVYQRLQSCGVRHPVMGRLRGTYRKSWCETQALIHATAPVVARLEAAGIRTMLIKGAALQQTYYRNEAVRPMADLDMVVEPANARAAIAVFRELGWARDPTAREEDLRYRHSMCFADPRGREIDLHWHLLLEACSDAASAGFWADAQPLAFGGVATRQLSPADTLLHAIIHGLRANPMPPIRWIADAMAILRAPGVAVDWDALVERAVRLRLTSRLALGLGYLATRFEAPVPPDVPARLRRHGPSLLERLENAIVLNDLDRLFADPLSKPWVILVDYLRVARGRGPVAFGVGFSHYLRYRMRANGRLELAGALLRRVDRRVRQELFGR